MGRKLHLIFRALTFKEKRAILAALVIFGLAIIGRTSLTISERSEFVPVEGGSYKEGLLGQPIAINPVISGNPIDEEISAVVYAPLEKLLTTHTIDESHRVYSLKLKEGLRWSDGTPLTSDDVVFTIRAIQDPDTASPMQKNWQGVVAERISELQVNLTLPAPYVFFETNIKELPVVPQHAFGNIPSANIKLSSYNLEPVGSGPYVFKNASKRKDGFIEEMRFERNEYFAGKKPYINNFAFRFYKNQEDLEKAFQLRHIQGFGTLAPLLIDQKKFPQAAIESINMPRYYAIFFNSSVNPSLKKLALREGLSLAIDRERIVREATNEKGSIIQSPIFLSEENIPAYNPEEARTKIASLKDSSLTLNLVVPNIDFLIRTAEIIKENWLAVGISEITIVALNPDDLINNVVRSRNYEAVLFGNVLENRFDLFPFWHSSQKFYPGLNLALYGNSKVDQNIERIRQEAENINRDALLEEIKGELEKDVPAAFLFSLPYTYIHAKGLGGFNFENLYIQTPSDRFRNIEAWHVLKVRLIK